jgi:FkbM family methyltransferase
LTRIAYFPVVEEEDQLIDLLSRAAWFLTFSPIDKVYVFVARPELMDVRWRVAPGMDPEIAQRFDALRRVIEFVPASREADLLPVMDQVEMVLRWRQDASPEWLSEATHSSLLSDKQVFEIDPHSVRMEGANFIDVSFKLGPRQADLAASNRDRFAEIAQRLGRFDQAVVLATGPSVSDYDRYQYDGVLGVVCNTVILNEELMEAVQPEFVVFADPNFHFGPSQYAASFRDNLRRAAERFEFTICTPLKYYAVFTAAVPELADRTIAIPFRKDREFNFDLASDFELRTTANVLTFVMLPLATTFARTVSVLGCDGRPLSEDTYFWRHNSTTQIDEKMKNIREVHPGFFKREYNDYYLEHCQILDEQLSAGERSGYRFESLAESHIPAFKERVRGAERVAPALNGDRQGAARGGSRSPRLLVIDSTRVAGENATGQLKRTLLAGWPDDAFLQISAPKGDRSPFAVSRSLDDPSTDVALAADGALLDAVASFQPEAIYYRPTIDQHPRLHALALKILTRHPVPLVTHIMDDWPSRLAAHDETRGRSVDQELRSLLARSDKVLSISDKASAVLGDRYGVSFEAIANGVDPDTYRAAAEAVRLEKDRRSEVVLRYCGALAKDMTFHTAVDVARAVDALQGELPVRFEVYTMPAWRPAFEKAVAGLGGIAISDEFTDDFPSRLAAADVLVLPYNFDQESLRYVGIAMPNKLPEYLASGAAVLAVGPREACGIDYVLSHDLGCCVTDRDPAKVAEAIRRLATDSDYRNELAAKGQAWAFEHLNLANISNRFQAILSETAGRSAKRVPLLGPYSRDQKATVDETEVISELGGRLERGRVLLDVGAHHGSSLKHFAEAGWTVVACEPDSKNRATLIERFGDNGNVSIDPRAVSDEPALEAPLFSSEQSSGISSLSAFHETHREAETVEVTTVAELVDSHALPKIDFLKIDVEGLDWNVLKGVPWDRIKPEVIECEFEDAKTRTLGHTYRDIADDLFAKGYTVYLSEWHPIVRYGVRHDWCQLVRYPTPLGSTEAWGNILAFQHDPGAEAVSAAFEACLSVEKPSAVEAGSEKTNAPAAMPTGLSRYERFYLWATNRNPAVLFLGRLGMWCARKARGYPALTAAYLALLIGLIAAGFLSGGEQPLAPILWAAAGVIAVSGGFAVAMGFNRFLIKETQHELEMKQLSLRRRVERAETSLRAERKAKEALEARLDELLSAQKAALARVDELHRELETAQRETLRHVSLRFAQADARAAEFDGLVLLVAPERSGSTWLFDLMRCHPAALFLPAADLYRRLGVKGRRYPVHLSDGLGPTIDIEVEEGLGARVPAFTPRDVDIGPTSHLAVEKIHPAAIRFDVPGFLRRVDEIGSQQRKEIRCCYLTRDPVDSIRSFLAYKHRESDWAPNLPVSSAPDLYLRTFEALRELVSERPGPVIRYEELVADPSQIVSRLYQWLWPEIDPSTNVSIASRAIEMTRRDRVERNQTGGFVGQADATIPSDLSLLIGADDLFPAESHTLIQKCRRLNADIAKLGVELPSASHDRSTDY